MSTVGHCAAADRGQSQRHATVAIARAPRRNRRTSFAILSSSFAPWLLPHAPPVRRAEAERVPPAVERLLRSGTDLLARDAGGRRHERGEPIEHAIAIRAVD